MAKPFNGFTLNVEVLITLQNEKTCARNGCKEPITVVEKAVVVVSYWNDPNQYYHEKCYQQETDRGYARR